MTARLLTLLVSATLGGALLAGCGSSKSSSQTTTTATTPPAASSSTTPSGASTTGLSGAALEQAVAQCKSAIQAQKILPPADKQKLEAVCPNAARGETAPVKKVAEEVCQGVINKSGIPAIARETALKACQKVK
jgi:hypothetical protein